MLKYPMSDSFRLWLPNVPYYALQRAFSKHAIATCPVVAKATSCSLSIRKLIDISFLIEGIDSFRK